MADEKKVQRRITAESLIEILEHGISREEESNSFYLEAASRAATPRQRKLLLQLAEEERCHRENLVRLLNAARAQLEIDRAITGDITGGQ